MSSKIVENVLEPVLMRVGSMIAGALVAQGLTHAEAATISNALIAISCVAAELVARKILRGR